MSQSFFGDTGIEIVTEGKGQTREVIRSYNAPQVMPLNPITPTILVQVIVIYLTVSKCIVNVQIWVFPKIMVPPNHPFQ